MWKYCSNRSAPLVAAPGNRVPKWSADKLEKVSRTHLEDIAVDSRPYTTECFSREHCGCVAVMELRKRAQQLHITFCRFYNHNQGKYRDSLFSSTPVRLTLYWCCFKTNPTDERFSGIRDVFFYDVCLSTRWDGLKMEDKEGQRRRMRRQSFRFDLFLLSPFISLCARDRCLSILIKHCLLCWRGRDCFWEPHRQHINSLLGKSERWSEAVTRWGIFHMKEWNNSHFHHVLYTVFTLMYDSHIQWYN